MDTSKNMSAFPVFDSNRAGMDYQCMDANEKLVKELKNGTNTISK